VCPRAGLDGIGTINNYKEGILQASKETSPEVAHKTKSVRSEVC
jgi:hypothetical protein